MRSFDDGELLSWRVARTRFGWMTGKRSRALDTAFGKRGMGVLFGLRALSGTSLVVGRGGEAARRTASTYLAGSSYALRARSPYGSDGAEVMLGLTQVALALAAWFPGDDRARKACLWFIAGQSSLSYSVAGMAKLASPVWRDGTALRDLFRTKLFGHPAVFAYLRDKPALSRALGWATIAGETLFPLVLIAPKPIVRTVLAAGAGFHVANASVMGLNRFVWSFLSTYPAIDFCARALRGAEDGAR
ncbi:hypothetical protein GCM10009754_54570 [Amycolatopsis minnesotensis]|uniref:HTTM-like domain-containing protein n=2 Tax=Amycolatopsis minnesotensis TaxID=337894 RepID=A0ABP5D2Y5_9PSEU